MLLVPNGTRNPKSGRPVQSHCKRGHKRIPHKPCKLCRNLRDKMKYQSDEAFRKRKKALSTAWQRRFNAEHGFWPSELYR